MTNETMGELLKAMETAGGKSDRWLFIAMGIILIAGFVAAIKHLIKQHDGLMAHHKASRDASQATLVKITTEQSEAMKKITADQNKTMTDIAVILDRNTCALEGNGEILTGCKEELQRCREKRG